MQAIGEFEFNKHLFEILKAGDGGKGLTIKKAVSQSSTYREPIVCKKQNLTQASNS
jgi:hypothetical protein